MADSQMAVFSATGGVQFRLGDSAKPILNFEGKSE
jgi:hypothetical protein